MKELYKQIVGKEPARIEKIAAAGSNRTYYRLYDEFGISFIGCEGTSREENHAFISLCRDFEEKQLPVPRVLAVSDDEMKYIQEDLGTTSLFDAIANGRKNNGRYSEEEIELLSKAIRLLPHLQILGAQDLDFSVCYPQPEFDRQNVFFDLNYFKYSFLKTQGVDFNEIQLEKDFHLLADDLLKNPQYWCFMYRDFQARNIMLPDGEPYLIDFQGGRRGPCLYDVASFLWQASAKYSAELRERLFEEYYDELTTICPVQPMEELRQELDLFVLFRTLQVLGAYGFRGRFERKQHFLDSIPGALKNLQELLDKGVCDNYAYLKEICQKMINAQPAPFKHEGLVVRVFSFSYKKGIPEDVSGNGGGYVFDCRSSNNPGRYAEYKKLTGRDKPVIDFLEKDGEILSFLDNIYPIVDFHVQRWIDRGFNDLQISFGCTGGQHRSVYSAEHVAHHLHDKFGVKVILNHREQNIYEEL